MIETPIFAPISKSIRMFKAVPPSLDELSRILRVDGIRFVAQEPKSENFEDGYEPRIFLKGEVQSRENNWHDFFNALVWQAFPQTKKAINKLQYELQKSHYPDKTRLPAENMLTLFDESGAIVVSRNAELLALIENHEWHTLFWKRRDEVIRDLQVIVFGHGLYEKALNPYVGMTAQALLFNENASDVDTFVAGFVATKAASLSPLLLQPLPILGVPGVWPANGDEVFYSNAAYFRPLRR